MLLLFICNYRCSSVITDEQQQHYTVTTTIKTTTATTKRSIYINCSIFNSSYLLHCNVWLTSPIVEKQMTKIWTHNKLELSTILGHQMSLLGVHLTECQPDAKNNPMSWWPYDVVLLLATRCLYQGGTSEQDLSDCSLPPQLSSWKLHRICM